MLRISLVFLVLFCLAACSANLPQIAQTAGDVLGQNNQTQMVRAIKDTLELSSTRASDLLSQTGGYSQHPQYRITFPENFQTVTGLLRQFRLGNQLDRIELLMNQAAEQAAVEAKAVFISAVRNMTVTDALDIIRGHDTAATEYFMAHTEVALRQRYQPIIEQHLQQVGFYPQYQSLLSAYQQLPLNNKPDLDLEQHVLRQSLLALFSQVAKEEQLIRQDPVGRGSHLIGTIFK